MPRETWVSVAIPEKLVKEIDNILGKLGYPSRNAFVSEAVRKMLKESKPRFEHYNIYEDHATIIDHELDKWIDVYFRSNKPWCEFCEEFDCVHVRFLLEKEDFRKLLKEKGFRFKESS